jgi:hypothetical protein
VLLYAVIFGGDVFINEDYKTIGIPEEEILKHTNKKVREWTK